MALNNVKSIRLDEDLLSSLNQDVNFSNLANISIKEHLNKTVWVPNVDINNHASLSPEIFLKRVKNVKYLRYSETAVTFTLYPTSDEELDINKKIYDYANGHFNLLHDNYVYFNIKFPVDLLLFLRSRSWENVYKSITGFLSLLYWSWDDKSERRILEEQLDKKTIKIVRDIVDGNRFDELRKTYKAYSRKSSNKLKAEYNKAYINLAIELGIDPIIFPYMKRLFNHIYYPFQMSKHIAFKGYDFEIKLPAGYMRDVYEEKDDWTSIVVKGNRKNDKLLVYESNAESWEYWIREFSLYHDIYNLASS